MKKIYFIYKYTFPNNKVYIGQTFHGSGRYGQITLYKTQAVYRAMIKYPDFQKEIIVDNLSEDEVDYFEKYYIRYYDSLIDHNKGYNCDTGGHLNKNASDETKMKLSIIASKRIGEKNPFYGCHHTYKLKQKYRKEFGKRIQCLETKEEYVSSEEAAQKLGCNSGNIRSACRHGSQVKINKQWFHFFYIEEDKPKFKHNNIKKVINIETKQIYDNLIEAGKSINKTSKLIGMCCRGKIQSAGGYHWRYADEEYNTK